jgi:hypothetical protein
MNAVAEDLEIAMIVEETVMDAEVLVASIAILVAVEIVEDVLNVVENVIVDRRGQEWIAKENRIVRMRTWSACK